MTTTEVARERRTADVDLLAGPTNWYKEAVIYELHVRAFQDGNGDGIGDFRGLIDKLDYLQGLGVTAIWLLPFYPSPLRDDGYDISDYRQVHPSYGTLRDFRLFLRAAHRRGIRVITELVLAHTSDAHPWFQRARRANPGSNHRNFYIWSDTSDRYAEARVIFKDFESSNWSFDPMAGAYYWHRFYSHQPSLNYDNPAVRQSILDVVDFWLSMGVDGLRLDAVPYLYAREGTTCENLPETFEFLRQLRRHIDDRFEGRMLLAEANQWPEDAVRYMGKDGEICQMAFHFPLMPRMFMAARQEDRYPMVDILAEIPATPPNCQWALFLRNHDELTLEMVTDEERDYMYRAYAQEPQARINVGIRRRLAPLLGNDRKLIEMMNGLLLSMPGTPIVYYGDEIGMGDNIYLGDRNAVRTPMQWNGDRNAGFSSANPQQLYLPVISDPQYHSQAVNVEAQAQNSSSLLWWMKRLIALRQRYKAFGLGSLEMLFPENRKVFAFIRHYGEERILCVFNLSRHAQCAELDLSSLRGAVPVELFGTQEFPPVGELPYFITLGPHGFYWFSLECNPEGPVQDRPQFSTGSRWEAVFDGPNRRKLESWLPSYLSGRRWFTQKTRSITSATILDTVPIPAAPASGGTFDRKQASTVAHLMIVQVELDVGTPECYLVPVAFLTDLEADDMRKYHPDAVLAEVRTDQAEGVLVDGVHAHGFVTAMTDALARRRVLPGLHGQLSGHPAPGLRQFEDCVRADCPTHVVSGEQSNSSVLLDEKAVVKFIRRYEGGVNPAVELGRFLSERAHFPHAPRAGGSLQYRSRSDGIPSGTVAILEQFVPNEGDGWSYLVDALAHGLEDVLASSDLTPRPWVEGEEVGDEPSEGVSAHPFVGPHLEWAALLGRRTAELHVALTSAPDDPDFAPELLTTQDRVALFHGARSLARQVLRDVVANDPPSGEVKEVLQRESEILQRLQRLSASAASAYRIRCHGDFHLGQVLWTGRDFTIIDFEGEPSRSLGWRRLKRPAAFDLAGMIRSLHYAGQAAALRISLEFGRAVEAEMRERCDLWLEFWHRSVTSRFLDAYLDVASRSAYLPSSRGQVAELLDFFRLEKALYELSYEMNSRPTWVDIPARGILSILGSDT